MKRSILKLTCALLVVALVAVCFSGCSKTFSNNTWNIGASGPLTGDASSYGISVQRGASLAFEEINNNGGLNGYKFAFYMIDDAATSAQASSAYDTLYDAGMQASLGSVTSASCEAFGTKAASDNVFYLTPSASADKCIETGSNAFRLCFGDPDQGTMAAKMLSEAGYKNVGCIYDSSDSYSSGVADAFKAKAAELSLSVSFQTFDSENKKDFSSQVEALKDCDAIFCPFYYTEASLVIKACAQKGCDAFIIGTDGFDGISAMFTDSDTISNEIKYITPFDVNSTEEATANFVKNFKAKYGVEPDQFAADGYDCAYALYEAMKKADVKDVNISASELCEILKSTFTSSDFTFTGATGTMTWDASGACTKAPLLVEFKK